MAAGNESAKTDGQGAGFVHLRTHSAYSLLEGALHIKALAGLCAEHAMPAVALTDTGNLFGALEFSEAMAEKGIQPIVGTALAVDFGDDPNAHARQKSGSRRDRPSIVLLAQDETGYGNLMRLSSRSFLDTDAAEAPHVPLELLRAHTEGLIALTGGPSGPVDQAILARQPDLARARLELLRGLYGNRLYVELQRHGTEQERECEPVLVDHAYELDLPLVATNECYFAGPTDFEAHDALICIAEGTAVNVDDRRQLTPEHYFKSPGEMAALFADLPEAIASTVEIARRCAFRPLTRDPILPSFAVAGEDHDEAEELRRQAREGLRVRLDTAGPAEGRGEQDYRDRLDFELDVIISMKFPGYFLIVADFIKWAKARDIPVGPGRGSGAGSVVAWSLTITDLDPLRFGLLFERFLNPERVSMPDFDIDFCQDRRDEVIAYVQEKYGTDQVAQIITFGKLQARAVLRDVGRVLQLPYGQVDRLCKLIPNNPANPTTLAQAIDIEPRLREARDTDETVRQMLKIGLRLEGLYRHASTHAAGVVIGDRPLEQLVPLYRDPRSDMPVTQYSMKWVEKAGLVKFDFLGLKTLTVLETAVKLLRDRGVELDLAQIPLDDEASYELMSRGDTVGIFQLESSGMRDVLRKLKPDRFEDIIALVALYRPGPMDNIPTFISCKRGLEEPNYLHPWLEQVLRETYGVIIYQEQVMQIAQILSGYSLGEADLLRRAMGKKIQKEMDEQNHRFVDGAVEKGVQKARAEHIFELVNKFAGYGFNKSHAAAYALVAYQTAYLKANHPVEFMAASMTLDMGNTDKLYIFKQEIDRMGVALLPPSINRSGVAFRVEAGKIRYSLAAIRNVGAHAVRHIEEGAGGKPYSSLSDFAERLNPRIANRRALESLAKAGAFDELNPNRAQVLAGVEAMLGVAGRTIEDREQGQNDLFGAADVAHDRLSLPSAEPWLPMERLGNEFEAVGFFLSGHPLDEYQVPLRRKGVRSWQELATDIRERRASAGKLAGTVTYRQERKSRNGNRFAFVGFSDPTGQFETVIFSDTLSVARDLLEPGKAVIVSVEADLDGEEIKLRAQAIQPIDDNALASQTGLRIFLQDESPLDSIAARLAPGGAAPVYLMLMVPGGREVEMELGSNFLVTPQIKGAIKAVPGVTDVQEI
jgi:DNA polymerase-3 subunit alpha